MFSIKHAFGLAGGLALVGVIATASAGVTDNCLRVEVNTASSSGTLLIQFDDGDWTPGSGEWFWQLSSGTTVTDGQGTTLATITAANLSLSKERSFDLDLRMTLGAADAEVTIETAEFSFPALAASSAEARLYGSAAVTDMNNNGFLFRAVGPTGIGAFQALYNGDNQFSTLINTLQASAGGLISTNASYPQFGYDSVGADVSSIKLRLSFSLTAGDRANLAALYELLPEAADCSWDRDNDGVSDCTDLCPADPTKGAPGSCGCGFSDVDSDGDGVADCDDNCVNTFNPDQADGDADGQGDACANSDDGPAPPTPSTPEQPDPSGDDASGGDTPGGDSPDDRNPDGADDSPLSPGSSPDDGEPAGGNTDPNADNEDLNGVTPEVRGLTVSACGAGTAFAVPLTVAGLFGLGACGGRRRRR